MKRDLYIDFAKGFATLSIIFIHTAFWSGQLYLPKEVRIFSLLLDVPVFFALSGLTSSGNVEKTMYRLLKLQITYMIFVAGLWLADGLFKQGMLLFAGEDALRNYFTVFGTKFAPTNISGFSWEALGNWFVHSYSNADAFPVVMGSFWYLKVYFIVTLFGVLVLRFFSKHVKWIIALLVALTLFFNFYTYPSGQVGYVAFYLAVFLSGNLLKGKKLGNAPLLISILAVLASLVGMFMFYGTEIFYLINKQKFPPRIPYIVWAMPSLLLVYFLYNRLKVQAENILTYVGKNAIFFYFAQGISSSLIYFLVDPIKELVVWPLLMILAFAVNVLLALLLVPFLKRADDFGWKILNKLRAITASK